MHAWGKGYGYPGYSISKIAQDAKMLHMTAQWAAL